MTCEVPYREKLRSCGGDHQAVVTLTEVWKGTAPHQILVHYDQGNGGNCGLDLAPGDDLQIQDLDDHPNYLEISTCNSGDASWIGAEDNPRAKDILTLWNSYRAHWQEKLAPTRSHPIDIAAWRGLADFLESNNDPLGAEQSFRRVIELTPEEPAGYAGLARVLTGQERFDEAVVYWQKARQYAPGDAEIARLTKRGQLLAGNNINPAEVDFQNFDLSRIKFDGADLHGKSFSGSSLRAVSFRRANLDGAVFTGARLDGVYFAGASLRGADFSDLASYPPPAEMDAATFVDADLAGARFRGNTIVFPAPATDAPATGNGLLDNFAAANLSGATLACASFSRVELEAMPFPRLEPAWQERIGTMRLLRRLQKEQPGASLAPACAALVDAYLALPGDCRPWSDASGRPYCALPE